MAKNVNICDVCTEIFAGGDAPKGRISKTRTEEFAIPIYSNGEENAGLYGFTDVSRVNVPSVTVSARGTIGYAAIRTEPFVPIVRLITLVPDESKIDIKYLYYAVQNYQFEGSGTSIPQLTVPMLKKYNFTLPTKEVQKNVVSALDKVNALIALRKEQLAKLDELVKARFVEMFGDMYLNTKDWATVKLMDIADVVSGITKGRKVKEQELFEVPYMAVSNVKAGYIDWTTVKTIMATAQEINQYRLLPNDVLMTEGGDPDKVGRGAIIKNPLENSIHQNHIFRVRLDSTKILPVFFAEYLQHPKAKRYFLGCAKQTTGIASINMQQLRALPVLMPPLELQEKFTSFVAQTDKTKLTLQESLDRLEVTKKALLDHFFNVGSDIQ